MPLEQEDALDVQRPLVVEDPRPASDDHLGHDHVDHGVRVGSELSQVGPERRPDITVGRVTQVERDRLARSVPLGAERRGFRLVERE